MTMKFKKCPECHSSLGPDGLPEGAGVLALRNTGARHPDTQRVPGQPRNRSNRNRSNRNRSNRNRSNGSRPNGSTVTARWIRPLGLWALQDNESRFARPPCGTPGETIVFRGPQAEQNARAAAIRWNQDAGEQRKGR